MKPRLIADETFGTPNPARVLSRRGPDLDGGFMGMKPRLNSRETTAGRAGIWVMALSAVAAMVAGVTINPLLLAVGGALLLAVAVGFVWPRLTTRRLACDLVIETPRCHEGEPALIYMVVENRGWLPVLGLTLAKGFSDEIEPPVAIGRIPARGTVKVEWNFVPQTRGLYPLCPPRLETRFPFGLTSGGVTAHVEGSLIVWPRVTDLAELPESPAPAAASDRVTDRRTGEFGDIVGVRAFRWGDSLRQVHWTQTARLAEMRPGEMAVRERQAPVATTVTLRPDFSADVHDGGPSLEEILRVTGSLVRHFHQEGQGCVIEFDGKLFPVGDDRAFRQAMDHLARVPAGGVEGPKAFCRIGPEDIVLTTDLAQSGGGSKTILLETGGSASGSEGPVWLRLESGDCLERLPVAWKEACRAA